MTAPATLATDEAFYKLLTGSYARLTGVPLVTPDTGARWLYEEAPFVVLAHNTDGDPKFIYANRAAQACFEYTWDEFIGMPSRLSAEPADRAERQKLLDAVVSKGFMRGYWGLRVAKFGRRFMMENGVVWELRDETGARHGQAATFSHWRNESS